ncbi:MAG: SEC-C metal-binding domain-containing protein [Myxococcota bacterium]
MVKHHAAALPDEGLDADAQKAYRDSVQERELSSFESIRPANLERDVYLWFGCQRELENYEDDPSGVYDYLIEEVGMSLSEQYERLLDLVDDLVTAMVEESCPPNKHYEDWELGRLADMYKGQFGIEVSGLERLADPDQMAKKLYEDAEGILKRKLKEFGAENYLRLFRNLYMEEIDRQWIEHLQAMDSLRDGIGLRGYGQRDPKREYKREGYERFMEMMRNIKGSVAEKIFRAERVTEEQHRRLEDQRRQAAEKRLQGGRASHAGAGQNGEASGGKAPGGRRPAPRRGRGGGRRAPARAGGAPAGEPVKPVTVQRERPKLGRNDPCHCGSGKKYKNCCLRLDQAAAAAAPPPE